MTRSSAMAKMREIAESSTDPKEVILNAIGKHDTHIFHRMMLVNVEISLGPEFQVKPSVLGEQLEHMVEEADPGGDVIIAPAFDFE